MDLFNTSQFNDAIPDIIVTQVASPEATKRDSVYFEDVNHNLVGIKLGIDQTTLNSLGSWIADFFIPPTGTPAGGGFVNSSRNIRIWAAKISDFGINASNYTQAAYLRYKLGGSSDPAFLAFNNGVVELIKANDDNVQTNANTAVAIPVLDNDIPNDNRIDKSATTVTSAPSHGTTSIDPATGIVTYTPNTNFFGTDQFTYQISSTVALGAKKSQAVVNINVGGPVGNPVFNSGSVNRRCQGAGSNTYTATAANNVGIKYFLTPANAGAIDTDNGTVTWNASFFGSATVTALAYGVNGPKSTDLVVTVDGTPSIVLTSAPGTDHQTVTATNTFKTITYQITNATNATFNSNITSGTTASYNSSSQTFTISGAPGLLGNYNYSIQTVNNAGFTCANVTANGTINMIAYPLPVTWGKISANIVSLNNIEINWSTITETNCKSFVVECQKVGEQNFNPIKTVLGSGNSNIPVNYQVTDYSKATGSYLYRIKQEDMDGKISYSNSVLVKIDNNNSSALIYPNPAKEYVHIKAGLNANITIYNANGIALQTIKNYQSGIYSIAIKEFPSGLYYARIVEKDKIYSLKFMIAR